MEGTDVNACELTASITALANTIANQFDDDRLSLLGAVFTQLGDTLATIAAQRALCGGSENRSQDTSGSETQQKVENDREKSDPDRNAPIGNRA